MTGRRPPLGCSGDIQGEGKAKARMEGPGEHRVVLGKDMCVGVTIAIACKLSSTFGSLHTYLQ